MRRTDSRSIWRFGLILVFALTAGLAWANANIPYDDRPPLLASETAENGVASATRLTEVELKDIAGGAVALRLEADGSLPYDVFELSGPDRLVIDLPGVDVEGVPARHEHEGGALVQVRLGQWIEDPTPVGRVVLDMTRSQEWTVARESGALVVVLGDANPAETLAELNETPKPTPELTPEPTPEPIAETVETAEVVEPVVEPVTETLVETAEAVETVAAEPVEVASTEPVEVPEPVRPEPQKASTLVPAPEPQAASTTVETTPEPVEAASTEPADVPAFEVETTQNEPETSTETLGAEPWGGDEIEAAIQEATRGSATEAPATAPANTYATGASDTSYLPDFSTKTIQDEQRVYTGRPITLQLVDADVKQVFSLFHEISGLNFVLDPTVAGQVTIVVDDVPWDQALDLILKNNSLDMVLEGNVVRIAPVTKLAQEAAARKALRDAKELEGPPVTITRTLSYAKADEVEPIIREAILSPNGRIIVDERTNSLIIRDIPNRVNATDSLLTTLDAETPQVMIEARVVEISRDYVKDIGISWGFNADADPALGTQTSLDFPHRVNANYDLNLPRAASTNALGFSFGNVLDSFTLDITLDALETEGYARRLSSPKIATQNNEPAEIEQGVQFPIVSTTATEIDVRFVAASLRLEVTPQITAEGTVVLELIVENNQPDFVNTVGEIPSINTQRAETKMMIADGGTTVIGGIFTVNEGRSDIGVPWFKDIPGLGWLFRSKNIQTRNRELLIFVTPRIIKAS